MPLRAVPGLVAAMVMGAASFAGLGLLLPVVPLVVSRDGGSDAVAGAVTATFMAATVVTQLFVPRLLRAFGHRAVLAAGCLFLGLPSLAFLWSTAPAAVLVISSLRGIGFGMLTVSSAAIVAELAPPRVLGRATGAQGIAVALSQTITLPLGLAIMEAGSADVVFVLGAVVPVLALVAVWRLPDATPPGGSTESVGAEVRLPWAPVRRRELLVPCLAVAAVAAAFGGVSSLLPIAQSDYPALAAIALSVVSGAMLIGRYGAGSIADRSGPGRVVAPGLSIAAVGMAGLAGAVALGGNPVLLMCSAVAFGVGFGACQNDSLVMSFAAVDPSRFGTASAAWNISFDAGTGAGALGLGVVAGYYGYAGTFAVGAAVIVVVAAAAVLLSPIHSRS